MQDFLIQTAPQASLAESLKAERVPLHDASELPDAAKGWRDWLEHVQGYPTISLSSVHEEALMTFYRTTVQKLQETTHTPPIAGWFTAIEDVPFTDWGWQRISLTAVPHAWAAITLVTEDGTYRFRLHDIPPLTHPNVLVAFTWLLALAESVRHAETDFVWDAAATSPVPAPSAASARASDLHTLRTTTTQNHAGLPSSHPRRMIRPTLVRGHIRDLKGKTCGPGRQELARAYDIVLPAGYTFVMPHPRGTPTLTRSEASQTWTIVWSPRAMIHEWRRTVTKSGP